MATLLHRDTGPRIARLIAEIENAKSGVNEEIDGWLIRRPSMLEVDDHFGLLFAESRETSAPLVLPKSIELCIGVIEGAVRLDGNANTLLPNQFFVIRSAEVRSLYAVQHPTKISAFFFRGTGDGPGVVPRQAA